MIKYADLTIDFEDENLLKKLKEKAKENGVSETEFIKDILNNFIFNEVKKELMRPVLVIPENNIDLLKTDLKPIIKKVLIKIVDEKTFKEVVGDGH